MQPDARHHHVGHHGITFDVTRYTVTRQSRQQLQTLRLAVPASARYQTARFVLDAYDLMLAENLDCRLTVAISKPLTRQQGDTLNTQRITISGLVAAPFSAIAKTVTRNSLVGLAVGAGMTDLVKRRLPTYHAGDIIMAIDLVVQGGIGPQHRCQSMIIPTGANA